ncbi:MAG: hypothetical protein K2V38_24550 [Gemmataceae bacterium]|nr:hypothetical protein [Gemmataceae bacterium]
MSIAAPNRRVLPTFAPLDAGLPFAVRAARFRDADELALLLRGLRHPSGRLSVVIGLSGDEPFAPADDLSVWRMVVTADAFAAGAGPSGGWFEPDPATAVVTAMSGLEAGDALVLLLPADWTGDAPDELLALPAAGAPARTRPRTMLLSFPRTETDSRCP